MVFIPPPFDRSDLSSETLGIVEDIIRARLGPFYDLPELFSDSLKDLPDLIDEPVDSEVGNEAPEPIFDSSAISTFVCKKGSTVSASGSRFGEDTVEDFEVDSASESSEEEPETSKVPTKGIRRLGEIPTDSALLFTIDLDEVEYCSFCSRVGCTKICRGCNGHFCSSICAYSKHRQGPEDLDEELTHSDLGELLHHTCIGTLTDPSFIQAREEFESASYDSREAMIQSYCDLSDLWYSFSTGQILLDTDDQDVLDDIWNRSSMGLPPLWHHSFLKGR